MERTIDRTCYRRSNSSLRETQKSDFEFLKKKIKKFLYQSLIASIILLGTMIVRMYKYEPVYSWLTYNVNKEDDLKSIYEYGQNSMAKMTEYIKKSIDDENENVSEEILDAVKENSDVIIYEEAVEGVNQMIDDAEYIKENYNFKHPIRGTITSTFGVRISENPIVTSYHSGIDVAANTGTNIYAAIGGEVITATTENAYGKYIMIKTDEDVVTLYAHCSELKVKVGQKIKQGELIAKVGSTGWATGPHLHFEIRRDGRLVDPSDVLDYSTFDRS